MRAPVTGRHRACSSIDINRECWRSCPGVSSFTLFRKNDLAKISITRFKVHNQVIIQKPAK